MLWGMRIIAGQFRGRQLLPPESDVTRPITDRVKQSLFDVITPLLPDSRVYDCFSGTGSMGLEAISRGAGEATFFEVDRSALGRLKRNIDTLKVAAQCYIVSSDIFKWFEGASTTVSRAIDLVFLDPPYRFLNERAENLRQLARRLVSDHLTPGGTVVFRHDAQDTLELPGLTRYDVRQYGSMTLELLRPDALPSRP